MNQSFETRSGDAVSSQRNPLTLGEDFESAVVATGAGDECAPVAADGTVREKRRVLLIESDPCLLETVRYYLAESGYTVVTFQNSQDALKAVLADDFALVLYDVMAPGLRGGMFYNSVERIDPELCERFVFMTCDRMDASTTAFIRNINGFVLRKPFDSMALLDAILSAEAHGTFEGVFDRANSIPDPLTPDDGGRVPVAGADAGDERVPHAVNAEATFEGAFDRATSIPDTLTPKDGGRALVARADAGDNGVPHAVSAEPWQEGSVLLIEGDPCFRETVRYYLAETGYKVVVCQDSRDGLKEVLAGDFTLVLYDPTTPGLPPDMFYQGVKRIDPELCERMVFMIGDRNDATTGAFIKKIDGFVLRKPFDARILADKISAAEVLGTLHGAFESALTDPDLSRVSLSVDDDRTAETPRPQVTWFAEKPTETPAHARTVPAVTQDPAPLEKFMAPIQLSDVIPAMEPQVPSSGVWRVFAFAALALLGVLFVARWSQHPAAQPPTEAETGVPHSSPAIRSIFAAAGAGIELLEVRTRAHTEDLGVFEVRIRGEACGSQPRVMADEFRQAVEASLTGEANLRLARVHIEQLEDVPGVPPDQNRAAFLMIATVESIKAAALITKE